MAIRNAKKGDFENIMGLYKVFFLEHNIFVKSDDEVMQYLEEQAIRNGLFVYEDQDEIKGAFFLVQKGQDDDGSHKLWKFRHFAFTDEIIGKELLDFAENIVREGSDTAKVENTIAETEDSLEFFKTHGYELEGTLKDHYRWHEACFIFSKSLG